jgi:hypothetical protein
MNTLVRILASAVVGMIGLAPAARAAADTAAIEMAKRAISMGYGARCSLEMIPVDRGGYYPCIDIAPYRIVFLYGSVRAFVVQDGRIPYQIMEGTEDRPAFADGPWTADMSARVSIWWHNTVEGGAKQLEDTRKQGEEKAAAEAYINKLNGKEEKKPVAAPAPVQVPEADAAPAGAPENLDVGDDIKQILTH